MDMRKNIEFGGDIKERQKEEGGEEGVGEGTKGKEIKKN